MAVALLEGVMQRGEGARAEAAPAARCLHLTITVSVWVEATVSIGVPCLAHS